MLGLFDFSSAPIGWLIILTIAIFGLLAYLVSKKDVGFAFLGLLKILLKLLIAPLAYFKELIIRLTGRGKASITHESDSNQYLVITIRVIIEGLQVLLGVMLIAAGLYRSFSSSLRSEYEILYLFEGLLATFVSFILFIWITGLAIELIFTIVDLAEDVHIIRRKSQPTEETVVLPKDAD
jgi:hypothetical protein